MGCFYYHSNIFYPHLIIFTIFEFLRTSRPEGRRTPWETNPKGKMRMLTQEETYTTNKLQARFGKTHISGQAVTMDFCQHFSLLYNNIQKSILKSKIPPKKQKNWSFWSISNSIHVLQTTKRNLEQQKPLLAVTLLACCPGLKAVDTYTCIFEPTEIAGLAFGYMLV